MYRQQPHSIHSITIVVPEIRNLYNECSSSVASRISKPFLNRLSRDKTRAVKNQLPQQFTKGSNFPTLLTAASQFWARRAVSCLCTYQQDLPHWPSFLPRLDYILLQYNQMNIHSNTHTTFMPAPWDHHTAPPGPHTTAQLQSQKHPPNAPGQEASKRYPWFTKSSQAQTAGIACSMHDHPFSSGTYVLHDVLHLVDVFQTPLLCLSVQ